MAVLCAFSPAEALAQTDSLQDEVLANLKAQPVGSAGQTLDDLNLPDEFLRRAADRIIRTSFEQRFRMVVDDTQPPLQVESGNKDAATPGAASAPGLWRWIIAIVGLVLIFGYLLLRRRNVEDRGTRGESLLLLCAAGLAIGTGVAATFKPATDSLVVVPHELDVAHREYWSGLSEGRPELRGWRAPILAHSNQQIPTHLTAEAPPELKRAAEIIAKRLARDGLLSTTAQALEAIKSLELKSTEDRAVRLREAGLPVDLLDLFVPADGAGESMLDWIATQTDKGASAASLAPRLNASAFRFRQTRAGFQVATESGEHGPGAFRLQLSRGGYWQGQGDGGNVDLLRQIAAEFSSVGLILSIEAKLAGELRRTVESWPPGSPERHITVIAQELPVSQWTQDNAKPGLIEKASETHMALLAPRYASRGEDGSHLIPGDTLALDGLAAAGIDVIQSPLLFQGGNLLAVRHPTTGEQTLLIGEAEIYRNTALGLSQQQVLESFRIEFGVDRCEVLPSVCFHIDYDFTVRASGGKLFAFVNDTMAAVGLILLRGLDALEANDAITVDEARIAREHLANDRLREFIAMIGDPVLSSANHAGYYPLSLAEMLVIKSQDAAASPAMLREEAVGNFQRFLLALDIAASQTLRESELPSDRGLGGYLEALKRRERDREALHQKLATLGFEVVLVPSLADAERSINAINGIHLKDAYIMPAYGGLFAPLDEAASAVFRDALGSEVKIIPIDCAESQRRVGAVHCSVSALPQID